MRKTILASLAAALAATASAGFLNADFESEINGPFGGWKIPATGVWKIEQGAGLNGTRALVYSTEDPKAPYAWVTQKVAIEGGRVYEFSTKIRTTDIRCDRQGATIFISWRTPDGKPCECWGMGSVMGDHPSWSVCGATADIPAGVTEVCINLILRKGSVGKAYFDDVVFAPLSTRIVPYVGSDAYRQTVAEGPLTLSAAIDHAQLPPRDRLAYEFSFIGGDGSSVVREAASVDDNAARLTINAGRDLAMGNSPLVFSVREKTTGKVLASATNRLNRVAQLPVRKVEIDRYGRLIVEGKPFFPLGFYCKTVDERLLSHLKDTPFNVLMPYDHPRDRRPFDLAQAAGVRLIYHFIDYFVGCRHAPNVKTEADERAEIERKAKMFRDHPALLAWYMSDEKPLMAIPSMEKHQCWLEELDAEHPTWTVLVTVNAQTIGKYLGCSDVIGTDPYPIGLSKKSKISLCAETTRDIIAATKGMRSVWQVPQVFDWTAFNPDAAKDRGARAPTRDEMANMYWQLIAEGANGLIAYTLDEKHLTVNGRTFAERWPEIVSVGREIKAKESVILSVEPAPAVVSAPDAVSVRVWRLDGKLHVLAVNTTRESKKGEIVLSDGSRYPLNLPAIGVAWFE